MANPLEQLKPPQLPPVALPVRRRLMPTALPPQLARLRQFARQHHRRLLSLAAASGLVIGGVLVAQSKALSGAGQLAPVQDNLWQATGTVRQSIVGLYRAERVLVPAPAAGPASPAAKPAAAKPGSSSRIAAAGGPALAPAPVPAPAAAPAPVNPGSTIDTNLEMRVAIARNVSSLDVGVSTDGFVMNLDGQGHCNLAAQTSATARATGQGIDFGDCQLGTAVWLEAAEGGYVFVNDSWFKGRVLLLNEGGSLIAVNFVLLQDYLSSVVGSEMYVDWPIEALKAQAIAARSYALTHHVRPASRHYDLDNTQRYQAYLGIAKETNTTQLAVTATSGEFISYDGGIVESLYAASDQIVQEAHGGQGMSQTGAMQLASQGYTYSQILANYYPGTGLSRLVVE